MRLLLLLLLLLSSTLPAVILTVKTTGGDFPATEQGLRDALASPLLTCGSELQIEAGVTIAISPGYQSFIFNKDCPVGNEVTLTTTMKAWLPDHDTRITPSYKPLLPLLYSPRNNPAGNAMPILTVSIKNGLANGITIRGIGFLLDPFDVNRGDIAYSNWALEFGQEGVCDILTSPATNLTAEHLLFLVSDNTHLGHVGGAINISGRSVRYLNSWLDDARFILGGLGGGRPEEWGMMSRNGGNDYTIRNNHFGSGVTEHIMLGVGGPNCQFSKEVPQNITVEHNHFYNSMKWFGGSPTYLGTQIGMKNFFECKSCKDVRLHWNHGENQWAGVWGGQYYAITMTPRMSRDQSGCYAGDSVYSSPPPHPLRVILDSAGTGITMGYFNTTDNVFRGCTVAAGPDHCAYVYPPGWAPGGGISLNIVPNPPNSYSGWSVREIATVTDQFHFTVTSPFPLPAADMGYGPGNGLAWDISQLFNTVRNIHMMGNYWKNSAMDGNLVIRDTGCVDPADPVGTTGGDIQYVNNLHVDSDPNFLNCCDITSNALLHWSVGANYGYGGGNFDFSHNTRYQTNTAAHNIPPVEQCCDIHSKYLYFDARGRLYTSSNLAWVQDTATPNVFGGMKYNNNLILPSGGQSPVNWYPMVTDTPLSQFLFNASKDVYYFPEFFNICYDGTVGTRLCANPPLYFGYQETYDPRWRDEKKNGFMVTPDSDYHNTASDGKDAGADMRNVTAIQDLTVTSTDVAAWFRFNLTGPICHLPAQIEVSADSTLNSDLGPFTVVNAINPTMFMRADSDRVNPRATPAGCSRMFMVGDNASVTDDNTLSRDLRLTPNTKYYYRLSVGGAQERGEFTTTAPVTAVPASWPLPTKTPTTHYKLQSGPNRAALVTGAATPCGPSGCTITLTPDANSRQFVYYILGCNSAGVVSNTWGPYFQFITR